MTPPATTKVLIIGGYGTFGLRLVRLLANHPGMTVRMARKEYDSYSGYPGGRKVRTGKDIIDRKPEMILHEAVRRMLPKNKLGRQMLKKLKLVVGTEHTHQAQLPTEMPGWMLGESE